VDESTFQSVTKLRKTSTGNAYQFYDRFGNVCVLLFVFNETQDLQKPASHKLTDAATDTHTHLKRFFWHKD
jgi:hypothetical protein